MKYSAALLATLAASAQAFAPSRPMAAKPLAAATLEAPAEAAAEEAPAAPVEADMAVEKDFPIGENFVKDSDRIMP